MKTNAIIFDMDGVLVDSEPLWLESEYEVFKTVGIDTHNVSIPIDTLGLRVNEAVAAWYHQYPWQKKTQQQVMDEIITTCIDKITAKKPTLPGVIETLDLCRSLNLKIGLATSSASSVITAVLKSLEIAHYFDSCYSAEYLEHGKPHPEVYLLAAKALGVSPLNCVTVEDSINGMVATKAARMRSIVVPAKENQQDQRWSLADIKLNTLLELKKEHLIG